MEQLREILASKKFKGQVVEEEELEELAEVAISVVDERISLVHADIREGRVVRERAYSADALVHVQTAAGIGGQVLFKSTSFEEVIDSGAGRVRRKYLDTFPPPGVEVIKAGKSPEGGMCYLLRMMPCSSFRIERTGALEDAPSVLTVAWRGRRERGEELPLQVFAPQRPRDHS